MALLSMRAYAQHRRAQGLPGGTHKAVQKAVQRQRIRLTADGKVDSDAADRDWGENTSEGHRRGGDAPPVEEVRRAPPAPTNGRPHAAPDGRDAAADATELSLVRASALEKVYKARLARLEFEQRSGQLVSVEEVRQRWQRAVTLARSRMLALPTKVRSRLPSLGREEILVVEELVRQALEELADADG